MLRELSANVDDYHAVVYAQPSTDRRVRLEDEQSVNFLIQALGASAARRTVVALTYANELTHRARGGKKGVQMGGGAAKGAESEEKVIAIKTKQVGELFDAAVALVGGGGGGVDDTSSAAAATAACGHVMTAPPAVAVGEEGDGTKWESALWTALIRRAKAAADSAGLEQPSDGSYDATAQEFDVDWEGLRTAGVVTESKPPPPPPPLELVRAYVNAALGEFDNSLQRESSAAGAVGDDMNGGGEGEVDGNLSPPSAATTELVERSVFTVKQRGMPTGFAATIILEVRGPLEGGGDETSVLTNQLYMLMPGAAANTVMKVPMGSIPRDDLPHPAALRRGGTEVRL